MGDSITEGGQNWSQKLGIPKIRNRGISGDMTNGVLKRLAEITHFKPKAIIILIGINDLYNIHYQKEIPSAEYVGNNIIKITEILREKSPETKIFLQTVLPTTEVFMKANIAKVNNIIKTYEKNGVYKVIALNAEFSDKNGLLKKELTTDGVHLNDKGYTVWVELIKPFIDWTE